MPIIKSWPCAEHPESASTQGRQPRCLECMRIYRRQRYRLRGASVLDRYHATRHGALRRGIEFGLSLEQFRQVISQSCVYGCPNPEIHVGVDRIESGKGYTVDNVQPCCERHNRFKSDVLTHDQMIDAVRRYEIACGNSKAGRPRK